MITTTTTTTTKETYHLKDVSPIATAHPSCAQNSSRHVVGHSEIPQATGASFKF